MANETLTPEELEIVESLERSFKERERFEEILHLLTAPDQEETRLRLEARANGLEARVRQLETTAQVAREQADRNGRTLTRLRSLLGVEKDAQLLRAVEALTQGRTDGDL
jgi:hypothetical protein